MTLSHFDDDEKDLRIVDTPGGQQKMLTVTEPERSQHYKYLQRLKASG